MQREIQLLVIILFGHPVCPHGNFKTEKGLKYNAVRKTNQRGPACHFEIDRKII